MNNEVRKSILEAKIKLREIFSFIFLAFPVLGQSQHDSAFNNEVNAIIQKYDSIWDSSQETIVFTGSSSVRMWKNIQELFPEHQIINSGFGGSQTIDLLDFTNELILNYKPAKVFIYEGDNDISANKKSKEILDAFATIVAQIKNQNSQTKIVLISPKPSIVRWHLKRKYKKLNRKLKRFCKRDENIEFADVWNIMLDKKRLRTELFIEDGLHMNAQGYDLWYAILKNYLD